jgi:uncharacterized protein (TIGR02722 family)
MRQNTLLVLFGISVISGLVSGCGGEKAFTKGSYDDPTQVMLLDDKFNEADMQQMADSVIKALVACPYVSNAQKPPIVIVDKVQNRTDDHIDMVSLTDMVRTSLIKSGKVRFVDKQARGTLDEEYQYNASGAVSGPTQKKKGNQIGADYILNGEIATNVQQVGDDKFVYYKITVNMTNVDTSTIDCVQDYQLRKKFKRQSVGL